MTAFTPRPATPADFPFIRTLAGHPGNTPFITDEDEAGLARYLADPSARLQIWLQAGQVAGFALWCGLDAPSGAIELRRLALAQVGGGRGLAFVRALTAFGFQDLQAKRIWLDASAENPRAAKVYEQAGFTLEGRLRAHWFRPVLGRTVDLLLFGMLREEWQSLPR